MDPISRIFLKKLTGGELSDTEKARLEAWCGQNDHNRGVSDRLGDLNHLEKEYHLRSIINPAKALADMQHRISTLPSVRRSRQVRHLIAAAVIIAICLTGGLTLYHFRHSHATDTPVAEASAGEPKDLSDFKHGQTKAILTDESGKTLALNQNDIATPATELFKEADGTTDKSLESLKLEVPRGGEFKVILEDSTVVWLNSESTLRYPKIFGHDERRVEMTGETYFAVNHDARRPFYVVSGNQQIRVYGTTFNVRGYSDDDAILTTLESGSISMTRLDGTGGELKLSPGHQAVFDKSDSNVTLRVVNPKIVTGWRHGKFVFDEQPLSTIMRDLSRWYNFDYEFADNEAPNVIFKGSIPRYADFKEAITILELSGGLHFSVANNRIVVEMRH